MNTLTLSKRHVQIKLQTLKSDAENTPEDSPETTRHQEKRLATVLGTKKQSWDPKAVKPRFQERAKTTQNP